MHGEAAAAAFGGDGPKDSSISVDAQWNEQPLIAVVVSCTALSIGVMASITYWIFTPGASKAFVNVVPLLVVGSIVLCVVAGVAAGLHDKRRGAPGGGESHVK